MKSDNRFSKQFNYFKLFFIGFLFLLFSYSSINKILNYSYFNIVLSQFPLLHFLPPLLIEFLSILIIVTEIAIGFGILISHIRRPIALIGIILSTIFCLLTLIMIFFGEKSACGCFAPLLEKEFNFNKLYQNILILLLFIIIWMDSKVFD